MESVKVRPAKVEDALEIANIHVQTWQCAYRGQIPDSYLNSLSIQKRTEGWKKQLEKPEKGVNAFVIEVDGKVVGWCTAGSSRDEDSSRKIGELHGIYIHPDYIGKGLGTKLMDHVLNVLTEQGFEKVTLWVLGTNLKTRKWYESKGWKADNKTKTEIREGYELKEIRYSFEFDNL